MKMIDGFMLREIAGEYVAVPSGEAAQVFNGLLTLNETGAEVFRRLVDPSPGADIARSAPERAHLSA